MAFKTLLVHVEGDPSSDPGLALAVDLANRFGATLIGVGAEQYRTDQYATAEAGYAVANLMAVEMASVDADLKRAEEKFRTIASAVKAGSEWRVDVQLPLVMIAAEARSADLVIAGRSQRKGRSIENVAALGPLILRTGRPVLVAPPAVARLDAARVLVAWKDTREARRALADALPFLKAAEIVELVEIVDRRDDKPAAAARLADVADYLRRHDIAAVASVDIEDKHATGAQQLLDFAAQKQADLIVAGAYGHSRLHEWVFGGFTRAMLVQSGRPVLFSH